MDAQEILEAIRPGLTLYAVLVTFAIVAFKIAAYFWQYEKTLAEEMVDRVRELMATFRQTYVEPIISKKLKDGINAAYDLSLSSLLADIYEQKRTSDGFEEELLPQEQLQSILALETIQDRFDKMKADDDSLEEFFSSKSGLDFFEKLDAAYQRQQGIARRYRKVRHACVRSSYAFLAIAVVCLLNLVQILWPWPQLLSHFSVFVFVSALAYGIFQFACLESGRRRILTLWEEKQFHENV